MAVTQEQIDALHTAAFWDAAPAHDSLAFWSLVIDQPGERDAYGRDLLIYGHGAAGPIRCTREYAEAQRREAKRREAAARAAETRRRKQAESAARIRAIHDRALTKQEGR